VSVRDVHVHGVHPVHDRGAPMGIEMTLFLTYLKGGPIAKAPISREQAIRLIEQLAAALRVTEPQP